METNTQKILTTSSLLMQLYYNARLKHKHKELKNLLWRSLLIYEETSVHN